MPHAIVQLDFPGATTGTVVRGTDNPNHKLTAPDRFHVVWSVPESLTRTGSRVCLSGRDDTDGTPLAGWAAGDDPKDLARSYVAVLLRLADDPIGARALALALEDPRIARSLKLYTLKPDAE